MKRARVLTAAMPGNVGPMKHWRYITLHAVAAAAFFFVLQRYTMNASLELSLLWALVFGTCAAAFAYAQSNG